MSKISVNEATKNMLSKATLNAEEMASYIVEQLNNNTGYNRFSTKNESADKTTIIVINSKGEEEASVDIRKLEKGLVIENFSQKTDEADLMLKSNIEQVTDIFLKPLKYEQERIAKENADKAAAAPSNAVRNIAIGTLVIGLIAAVLFAVAGGVTGGLGFLPAAGAAMLGGIGGGVGLLVAGAGAAGLTIDSIVKKSTGSKAVDEKNYDTPSITKDKIEEKPFDPNLSIQTDDFVPLEYTEDTTKGILFTKKEDNKKAQNKEKTPGQNPGQ